MATVKISELPAILGANTAATDVLPIVDVSGNITNKITRAEFFKNIQSDVEITDKIVHSGDTNTAIRFPAADTVTVETSGLERMRIDSSGRVGLGVINPALRFQVAALSSSSSTAIAATDTDYTTTFRSSQLIYNPVSTTGTTYGFSNSNLGALSFLNCDNVVIGTNGNVPMAFATTGVERMRITGAGNVLAGDTIARATVNSTGTAAATPSLQQTGTSESSSSVGLFNYSTNTSSDPSVLFNKSLNATIGSHTAVTSDTQLGGIGFNGSDGTAFAGGAYILANTDGTVASGSVPSRLVFATTPVAGTSPTERMRITAAGNVGIGNTAPIVPLHVTGDTMTTGVVYKAQPAQASKAAAATLTVLELENGLIQYTGTAATLTLPTGTDIETGTPNVFPVNMAFDFSVINTGSGTATLGTATGLTLVGSMAVAAGVSGMFRVRKTALNTYTVYRIG